MEEEKLICSVCKQEKLVSQFTKANRSKDNKRGLCKECKQKRDAVSRAKKDLRDSELPYFELSPDMLSRNKGRARIGVLALERVMDRANAKDYVKQPNVGLQAILSELNEPYEYCRAELINAYEFVLVSLTSVMDVENLVYTMERFAPDKIKPKIIVGGFGVVNVKLIIPYIDIACFGRGEGQINDIIAGKRFGNVWRKEDDQILEGKYAVRQPRYLVDGENSVGCRNRCKFCQYTWIRQPLEKNQKYNPGAGMSIQETDWAGLIIDAPGRYTTAWDGWSEATRLKVSKPVRDQDIVEKLLGIDDTGLDGGVNIKVFQIVGYPWETPNTIKDDISKVANILRSLDRQIRTKIYLAFLCTPFGPEPLTPMQYEPGNIYVNWREELMESTIYKGNNINAFIIPVISGPFTLVKRMLIHRSELTDLEVFKAIAFNSKLKRMPERWKVPWLIKNGYIQEEMFGRIERAAFDYLYIEGKCPSVVDI